MELEARFKKRRNSIERDDYPKDYFKFARFLLIIAGVYEYETNNKTLRNIHRAYFVCLIVFVYFQFILAELIGVQETLNEGLEAVIKNLSMTLTNLLGALKILVYRTQKNRIKQLISVLENEEFHYEKCEVDPNLNNANDEKKYNYKSFNPGIIFKRNLRNSNLCCRYLYMIMYLILTNTYASLIYKIIWYPTFIDDGTGQLILDHELPYYAWYPFNYKKTQLRFILTALSQCMSVCVYAHAIIGMDTLFLSSITLTTSHITSVREAMRALTTRAKLRVESNNQEELTHELTYLMKRSINHLQIIIKICQEIEYIFRFLILGKVVIMLFILCSCLFLVSNAPVASTAFMSELMYASGMYLQLGMYCWFGNEIYLESSALPESLYDSEWQTYGKELNTLLLITMTMMRRPLCLTVYKFAPLTLSTFVTIIRGSYSFFAVLKHVNDPSK